MSITKKYGFKVCMGQFRNEVPEHYEDPSEEKLIRFFEKKVLELQALNKSLYTMIELGANHSYYSLLFKHILGKDKTLNIMIEPFIEHMKVGQKHFEMNSCEGVFYNCGVGKQWNTGSQVFDCESITLEQLIKENNINDLDILHCDIDGWEKVLIKDDEDFFKQGKAKLVFLLTHNTTELLKDFFNTTPYTLIYEVGAGEIGGDGLLVYERK